MDEPGHQEQRSSARFSVVSLDIFNVESNVLFGQVVNISYGGLLIMRNSPVMENTDHNLRIPFGADKEEKSYYDIRVKVVWWAKNEISGMYSIGVKFLDTAANHYETIQRLIEEHGSALV
ncbi:MAG: PilZ domain-containing protein [Anaerolineae bacterium]|nr:PilZ domain-containing protein [Anaerolineae bacterium]